MLTAHGLTYRHARHGPPALEGASLALAEGEVLGLTGPSGCGKSTLARLLAGYLRPQGGRVVLDDHPLPTAGPHPVQMLFQQPELAMNPRWTVRRILQEAYPADHALLTAFGISSSWLERYPHELSSGELQRVAIVRALAPATRYLVADEISAMLDPIGQALIWPTLLRHLRVRKIGILVISHDLPLLERLGCQILRLWNGQMNSGSPLQEP